MCSSDLQLNSHSRKGHAGFQFTNFLNFQLLSGEILVNAQISPQAVAFHGFEDLINNQHIEIRKMRRNDKENQISFKVLSESMSLRINNRYHGDDSTITFKVNDILHGYGASIIKKSDIIDIDWR